MAEHSKIEWTDCSWNVISGCTRVSDGCRNCYSERLTGTRLRQTPKYAGLTRISGGEVKWTGEIRLHEDELLKPLSWKKPRRIFVNSMSDTFHEKVPFEFIDKLFAVMALCPQHTFQVLTKRPERMAEYCSALYRAKRNIIGALMGLKPEWSLGKCEFEMSKSFDGDTGDWIERREGHPLPNVWLGTSVENQEEADRRIPHLLKCPAKVRFLSVEPMLGPVDLCSVPAMPINRPGEFCGIHWVIVGGESGPGKRPMDLSWARSIRDQCKAAGVSFFGKQNDKVVPLPADLLVREFPR